MDKACNARLFRRGCRGKVVGEENSGLEGQSAFRQDHTPVQHDSLPQDVPKEYWIDVSEVRENRPDLSMGSQLCDPRRNSSSEDLRFLHV